MGHKNKLSMVAQVKHTLDSKLAIGESKHQAKKAGTAHQHIYSWGTYKSYLNQGCKFAKWAKETYKCKDLSSARQHVDEYLERSRALSPYTQKLYASSLAKLYSCSSKDFNIKTDDRSRADITRSRGERIRDKHFSEKRNQELINFCKSTGLRRSELETLKGNQLIEKDGSFFIGVKGKGGRYREAPVINEVKLVVDRMREAGENKVWGKVHNAADIHSYRGYYATSMYKSLARERNEIPKEDRYCCRIELSGVWYDKQAMLKVSQALGHNRISVIAGHYLNASETIEISEE